MCGVLCVLCVCLVLCVVVVCGVCESVKCEWEL